MLIPVFHPIDKYYMLRGVVTNSDDEYSDGAWVPTADNVSCRSCDPYADVSCSDVAYVSVDDLFMYSSVESVCVADVVCLMSGCFAVSTVELDSNSALMTILS